MSLRTQAEKLKTLEVEIGQLRDVVPLLQEKNRDLEDELQISEARQGLEGYFEKSESFFQKVEAAISLLETMVERTEKLNEIVSEIRGSNPLQDLRHIFCSIQTEGQFNKLGFPEDEFTRYRLFNKIMNLERQVKRLPNVVKDLSDFAYGLEYNGLKNLRIPMGKGNQDVHKGPVYVGRDGPKTKISPGGAPAIERHPEQYTEADVRKYGIEAANRV